MKVLFTNKQATSAINSLSNSQTSEDYSLALNELLSHAHGSAKTLIQDEIKQITQLNQFMSDARNTCTSFLEYDKIVDQAVITSKAIGKEIIAQDNLLQGYNQQWNLGISSPEAKQRDQQDLASQLKILAAQMEQDIRMKSKEASPESLDVSDQERLQLLSHDTRQADVSYSTDFEDITDVEIISEEFPGQENEPEPEHGFDRYA